MDSFYLCSASMGRMVRSLIMVQKMAGSGLMGLWCMVL